MLKERNFFKMFDIEPIFNINQKYLQKKYHQMSKIYHPDLQKSETKFQELQNAYNTLKNDYNRAVYLKQLEKGKFESHVNEKFLNKILTMEEHIENTDASKLDEVARNINKKIEKCKKKYHNEEKLSQWRYYQRLSDLISKKQEAEELKE
ncbi:hypothetical protein EDEG_02618 [Edhazardia aedis USNM 41457]|uniref:J domain-containing protein n=1 Tax=Edhazardia aedis (strain USNM 41457) TaxID=1003232 RepID=J9D607_EDHAE|nr:hypothetical protein EDEG_02618 [Edhazardia aedis USNM 41457]|eukprot:EJW02974.1 hypothetical protein EDEG_02618 [Edhazardia aedis USNM 41457]